MTDLFTRVSGNANPQLEPEWVDEVLLAGAADDVCLHLGAAVSRGELRRLVAERHRALARAQPGGPSRRHPRRTGPAPPRRAARVHYPKRKR